MRIIRRAGLLAGALAFLCQMVVWATMVPGLAADLTPICSANGVILVALDRNGQPDKSQPDSKSSTGGGHCPLCPLVAGLGAPPPDPGSVSVPVSMVAHDDRALPGAVIAAGWFLSTLQARAPPSVG